MREAFATVILLLLMPLLLCCSSIKWLPQDKKQPNFWRAIRKKHCKKIVYSIKYYSDNITAGMSATDVRIYYVSINCFTVNIKANIDKYRTFNIGIFTFSIGTKVKRSLNRVDFYIKVGW